MLIPIYKIGDVLVAKTDNCPKMDDVRDVWIIAVLRHEKLVGQKCEEEWIEYETVVTSTHRGYRHVRWYDEKDLIKDYKRIGHNDISEFVPEEVEKLKITKKDLEEAKEVSEAYRNAFDTLRAESLDRDNKILQEQEEPDYAMLFGAAAIAQAVDLRNELDKVKKENEELKAKNARYLQSMTCAKKQMTEAAKRICDAREHMDVALCDN